MSLSGELARVLSAGQKHGRDYVISEPVHKTFLEVFADTNPIHVDLETAKAAGFDNLVMHGAILNGFLSHFIGMEFPGSGALIMSVHINYVSPSFLGDTIRLDGEVSHSDEERRLLEIIVKFKSTNRNLLVARAKVQVSVTGGQ